MCLSPLKETYCRRNKKHRNFEKNELFNHDNIAFLKFNVLCAQDVLISRTSRVKLLTWTTLEHENRTILIDDEFRSVLEKVKLMPKTVTGWEISDEITLNHK